MKKINSFDPLILPEPAGMDTYPSDSTNNLILSSVYLDGDSFNSAGERYNGLRVKCLFRKGTTNSTAYQTQLYWASGETINTSDNPILLATVNISGSTSASAIERNLFFLVYQQGSFVKFLGTISSENDYSQFITGVNSTTQYNYPNGNGYIHACAKRLTTTGSIFDAIVCSYLYIDI